VPVLWGDSMIDHNALTADDVGRYVKYAPFGGMINELGRVKSWNETGVFVVYNCADDWDNFMHYTAAHTDPWYLYWITNEER